MRLKQSVIEHCNTYQYCWDQGKPNARIGNVVPFLHLDDVESFR